jgi:hypothetical protein
MKHNDKQILFAFSSTTKNIQIIPKSMEKDVDYYNENLPGHFCGPCSISELVPSPLLTYKFSTTSQKFCQKKYVRQFKK